MPPYHLGAPLPGGPRALLDIDFATWAPGFYGPEDFEAQPFVAPSKTLLRLARNYWASVPVLNELGETVQTSESTILRSPSETQTHVACIGRHAASREVGLVIQPCQHNYCPDYLDASLIEATRDLTEVTGWWGSLGGCVVTTDYAGSPDQTNTGCSRVQVTPSIGPGDPDVGTSPAGHLNGTGAACFATWQRSTDAGNGLGAMCSAWQNAGEFSVDENRILTATVGVIAERAASNDWGRISVVRGEEQYLISAVPVEGRVLTHLGGPPKTARDVLMDYAHCNAGLFPTEAIPSAHGTRPADKLRYGNGAALVASNGQIKVFCRLTTKHAASMTVYANEIISAGPVSYWTIFRWGAESTNYARIHPTTRKLHARIASGTEVVSDNALPAFAQYDVIELYVAIGNGIASEARYRINGGDWTSFALAAIPAAPVPGAAEVTFFSNVSQGDDVEASGFSGDTMSWCAWVHRLTVFQGEPFV